MAKLVIFISYLFVTFAGYWLACLNLSHLKKHGASIPPEFEGHIDQELLRKTRDYVAENTRFEIITSIFHAGLTVIFLFGNFLNIYNSWVVSLKAPFVFSGLIFFLLLLCAEIILTIPFKLYHTFKIENKYGFTTTTKKLWITDLLKSTALSAILMSILISAGLFIVHTSPNLWWFWVWCLFLAFSIMIMYIFPYVIEPLFNKFTPIEDKKLQESIRDLMERVGITVKRIFKMDASKRTKHTNAYFTGIGKVKRIVLYDTLLEKMDNDEILSVLAHETGHWKKRHLLKRLIATELIALIAVYISYRFFQNDTLIHLFGLKESTFFAKIVVIGFVGSIIAFPFEPIAHYFSRRHEIEADRFSCELTGNSQSMINTLVKLSKDNLSNLHPHPLYAAFYYSHPPVLERIRNIKEIAEGKKRG